MEEISIIRLDFAKNVFHSHGAAPTDQLCFVASYLFIRWRLQ